MRYETSNPVRNPVSSPPLDAALAGRLRALIRRLRAFVLLEGAAWVYGFLLIAIHVQFVLDYTRRLDLSMRAALLALIVLASGWFVWRWLLLPLRVPIGLSDAANLVERRHPRLGSLLVSAVQFACGGSGPAASNSPQLVASVVDRAAGAAAGVDFRGVVNPRRAKRAGLVVLACTLFSTVAILASPGTAALWFARNVLLQDVEWPKRTHLIVELKDSEVTAARGDDIEIRARAEGEVPRNVELVFETASGKRGRESMIAVGERGFRHTFKKAEEDIAFHLEGGDDETPVYTVKLADRPRVETLEMRIEPPAYTRLDPFILSEGQRAAQVLLGSLVTVTITTNKPVVSAVLMAGKETAAACEPDPAALVFKLRPAETQAYHVALTDEAGLASGPGAPGGRISIRVVPDAAPTARLKAPGVGEMITPQAVLPLEVEFADAYGLASADLVCRIFREGEGERAVGLPGFKPYALNFSTSVRWDAKVEAVIPGERVSFQARAADFDDVSGPNRGQSQELVLRVVTVDELLEELNRREQEARAQLERLVDAQEQIRSRLLTVLSQWESTGRRAQFAEALAGVERKQRNVANSVNVVRQQLDQVLAEFRINQLDTAAVEERLGRQVVAPLTELAKRDLITAADNLRQLARDADAELSSRIDPQQAEVISRMRAVLSAMLQWEGYQEVVSMLRDIMRLQEELKEEARGRAGQGLDGVFED